MSWIQKLYETYNRCESQIGYSLVEDERPLLPICHTTTDAHIEVVIDQNGQFKRASIITDKNAAATIIPCTEDSGSRSGKKPTTHPLCDKLQYLAGDFTDYGGKVTVGFNSDPQEPYRNYLTILSDWARSPFSHPKIRAILAYVKKKTLMRDLAAQKVLLLNAEAKLAQKKEIDRDRNTIDIFTVVGDDQGKAFVRWVVEEPGVLESRAWRDKTVWQSWIDYYQSTLQKEDFCYVTGKAAILTEKHPKYIRYKGDSAKLISSNDTKGYTYLGRFTAADQACNLSVEVSHKAHYALAWLISRQGYHFGDLAVVAWIPSSKPIPQPLVRTTDLFDEGQLEANPAEADTGQIFGRKLTRLMQGYTVELGDVERVQVIALDSATKGRLSITYYRELASSDYLERIERWHRECCWIHDFGYNRETQRSYRFVGAPSPADIAEAAYGRNLDDKLKKATVSRLLPCIIDGQPLPSDLVLSTARRAVKRVSLDHFEWQKALSVACALFRKSHEKENYTMALDPNRTTRDYLYGRLLALADDLEGWALNEAGEGNRSTNATRLMQRFSERPFSTWRTIELALVPYRTRLGAKAANIQRTMDEIMAAFDPEDFTSDKRLSGEFLLGYHSQKEERRKPHSNQKSDQDDQDETLTLQEQE